MADQIHLSCWLSGFTGHNALAHFQKALSRFPFSRLSPRATLRVYAIERVEPPVVEQIFESVLDPSEIIASAREFQNPDCGYEVDTYWDLVQPDSGQWKLRPASARLACQSPEFQGDTDAHLHFEFGAEAPFVPEAGDNLVAVQANIRSLLQLTRDLRASLPVARVSIWSDSGDELAHPLERALGGGA
jgi:hypothetical protein